MDGGRFKIQGNDASVEKLKSNINVEKYRRNALKNVSKVSNTVSPWGFLLYILGLVLGTFLFNLIFVFFFGVFGFALAIFSVFNILIILIFAIKNVNPNIKNLSIALLILYSVLFIIAIISAFHSFFNEIT